MKPRSAKGNWFSFIMEFTQESLKSGKIKDLNILFREVSLKDFSKMTGIPHHQLIGRKGDWSTLRQLDKVKIKKAFDLSDRQLKLIMDHSKP